MKKFHLNLLFTFLVLVVWQTNTLAQACSLDCGTGVLTVSTDPGQCEANVTLANPALIGACSSVIPVFFEGFDTPTQNAEPTGWSVLFENDPTGNMGGNIGPGACGSNFFTFGCTSVATSQLNGNNPDFSGNIAMLADDDAGPAADGTGSITSPVIDLSAQAAWTSLNFSVDYSFDALSSEFRIEATADGTNWDVLLTSNNDEVNSPVFDFLPYATATAQVRFVHDDLNNSWAWGAGFDNVLIEGVDPAAAPSITNDFNGTTDASGTYPTGTTTVTFTTQDATGADVTCTVDVVVEDTEFPVLACPGDQTIHLDPGACDQVLSYDVSATDNCPISGGSVSLTMNNDNSSSTATTGLNCGNGNSISYLQVYDLPALGATVDLEATSIDVRSA